MIYLLYSALTVRGEGGYIVAGWRYLNGIIFGIDSPLPKAGDLRNLWSYVFCKGVQMTTVADYLDNAGFNTTAKN